jgi:uncharacterized protein with NRDE domain
VLDAHAPRILGGRDERAGGTWLAVNEFGVFAGVTNQPLGDARDPTRRSRGELPLMLAGHTEARGAVDAFVKSVSPSDYNGCWLLAGDRSCLFFLDLTGPGPVRATELPPGLYALENRPLGAPSPKAEQVATSLREIDGQADVAHVVAALHRVLMSHHVPAESGGADGPQILPNCVHRDNYGTRSSCTVRFGTDVAEPPRLEVADGPPCTTSFVDVSRLWNSDEL